MSVSNLMTSVLVRSGDARNVQSTATIVDGGSAPVADVTVFDVFSGDVSGTPSGVTDGSGEVVPVSDEVSTRPSTIEFCIIDATLTYDPAANGDPSYACATSAPSRLIGTSDRMNILETVPTDYVLLQNYPNPSNPTTLITFDMPERSYVSVRVFNLLGQEVATLVHEARKAGYHYVTFDASTLSVGVYLFTMETDKAISTQLMTLLK